MTMAAYTDIEVSELESSAKGARYVLSHGGRHYEANATVVELLRTLQSHADEAEAIADYAARSGGRYSPDEVEAFVAQRLRPIVAGGGAGKSRQFLYERELLPARAIDRLSDALAVMFTPWVMAVTVMLALGAAIGLWAVGRKPSGNRA